ncbi:MAG: four-carbon acid sugar kinase family protein [Roseiarcus sp.]
MTDQTRLPDGLLLAFYGDDFTGSSAVMEVMTFAGLPAVMFVETPTDAQLQRFSNYRAIGIASVARAQPPGWMDAHLPGAFRALADLGAPVSHYKICSTLDSSPTTGSIGRAIDIGVPIFSEAPGAANWRPLVVAAPAIGRYQAFGNLFAVYQDRIFRLDRHPVMQRHPVTPMDEADVGLLVGRQTARPIGLVDFVAMKSGAGLERFDAELAQGRSIVSLDVVDDETLQWVGGLIWNRRGRGVFAIGSQGVEYALVAHWRAEGMLQRPVNPEPASKLSQTIAVSGSISAVTAAQTDWAAANGFDLIRLDALASFDDRLWNAEIDSTVQSALASLAVGRSPLVATARGPNDGAVARFREKLSTSGVDSIEVNGRIGSGLGEVLRRVMRSARIKRGAVSGGDTSGFAMRAVGAYALEAIAPIAPGAPLCRVFSTDPETDGFQITLKGGQMGEVDFFGSVRAGCAAAKGGTA